MPDPMFDEASEGALAFPPPPFRPEADAVTGRSVTGRYDETAADAGTSASSSVRGQVRQRLTGALDSQKDAAADKVEAFARTVGRSAEQFEGRQDWIAGAMARGAEELSTLAGSLRGKDVGDLLDDVGSFARRQPVMFAGVAFAAGVVAARVGKLIAGDLSRDDLPTVPEVVHGRF